MSLLYSINQFLTKIYLHFAFISVSEFKHGSAKDVDINSTNARYAGYTAGLARLFRYLAFTSDFGEALRPVVSARIVSGSYAVAIGYCFADVFWEGYKHQNRGSDLRTYILYIVVTTVVFIECEKKKGREKFIAKSSLHIMVT